MPEGGKKRTAESADYDYDDNKKPKADDMIKMRLLLVGRYCGAVVGKGGENLARLRTEHNCKLDMPSARTNDRVLSADGEVEDCLNLAKDILSNCPQAPYPVGQKCTLEFNLLVTTDRVGMVIGKGGEKLKEIRDQTNGKVKVYQECLPQSNERVVAIGGDSEDDVHEALKMILLILKDSTRGPLIPYDPNNKPSEIMGTGISGSGMLNVMDQGYSAMHGGHGVHGGSENDAFQQVSTVSTITVPNEMIGAIIGKGGNKISGIRSQSRAKIDFSDAEKDSKVDRIITITGTQQQVNIAEQMMSQCVRL